MGKKSTSLTAATDSIMHSPGRWLQIWPSIAMKIEACRAFAWKAAHYHDLHDSEGHAVGAMSKVTARNHVSSGVQEAMQVMGVNSLDRDHPVERHIFAKRSSSRSMTREISACKCVADMGRHGRSRL